METAERVAETRFDGRRSRDQAIDLNGIPLALVIGLAAPLALRTFVRREPGHGRGRQWGRLAAGLAIAGGIGLGYLLSHPRHRRPTPTRPRPEAENAPTPGVVIGRVDDVEPERIRVTNGSGRGYTFIIKPWVAPTDRLESWRDRGTPVRVRFVGTPDDGAVATAVEPVT